VYGLFEDGDRQLLYSPDFRTELRGSDPLASLRRAYDTCPSPDPLDRALYADVKTYLVDDILAKVDRMSMAVSLETRDPLLDHRLLEFVATIPSSLKLRNGRGKYLLRRLLERHVPRTIVERPKHGFEAPVGEWLRGPLTPLVDDLLLDGRLRGRGLFDMQEMARMWNEHRTAKRDHRHRLWNVVMLELWFREFVDAHRLSDKCLPYHAR
jgi:asparagine synthase (glutamine-hydrolysing)